jgi:hypothetical protein
MWKFPELIRVYEGTTICPVPSICGKNGAEAGSRSVKKAQTPTRYLPFRYRWVFTITLTNPLMWKELHFPFVKGLQTAFVFDAKTAKSA